jgi:hypothetical protein
MRVFTAASILMRNIEHSWEMGYVSPSEVVRENELVAISRTLLGETKFAK